MPDALRELIALVKKLRNECPWDRVQTLDSLKGSLIEEAYEVKDVLEKGEFDRLAEELGDLLILILMNAEIAGQTGLFDLETIAKKASAKLHRRHPHVFGRKELTSAEEVSASWQQSKLQESGSILNNVPRDLPSLMLAHTVQKRAEKVGFDWDNIEDVFRKVEEELQELRAAKGSKSLEARGEELGDLLFTIVNLARRLGIDPEQALRNTVEKFRRRFRTIERELAKKGRTPSEVPLSELDRLWDEAKEKENRE